jgi:hypothetical protein
VIGDAGAGEVRDVALRFEQFREAVTTVFPLFADDTSSGPPVVVFLFKNQKSFEPFLPLFNGKPVKLGGYYLPGRDVNYIALAADSRGPEFQTVYHEFTYVLIRRLIPNPPPWFDEGIAAYFSTFELAGRSARFGEPIERSVDLLRQRQMPPSELFAVTHDSPVYIGGGDKRALFDAESWALIHYAFVYEMSRRHLEAACCNSVLIVALLMSSSAKASQNAASFQDQTDKDFQGLLERVKQSEPSVDFTRLRRLYSESASYTPYRDDSEVDLESAVVAQSFQRPWPLPGTT